MKLRFFVIPTRAPQAAEVELNAFLASHRILRCDREFVADAGNSFWAVAVEWLEGTAAPGKPERGQPGKAERVDYREVLSEADFALYARLRELRKALAEAAGVPPYAVFTNEQLAEVVTRKVASLAALAGIEGVGPARVEKYGAAILGELRKPAAT
jgi:superfamily II DNA helicase RecQ